MNKLSVLKTAGIILIIISSLLWIGLLFVHFLPVSAAGKAAVYTVILIIAEILFWLGAALAGSEWLLKMRKIINPVYWFKRKYIPLLLALFAVIFAAAYLVNQFKNRDVFFQFSTISALMEGFYDGDFSFRELKKHGGFGLGTFNGVDGEMIALDGRFYQIKSDGIAYPANADLQTPFAAVTFFEPDKIMAINEELNLNQLIERLDKELPAKNIFYAVKIKGDFKYIKARSVPKQEKPYMKLVDALKNQVIFEFNDVSGVIVCLLCPKYMKDLNVPGYHLHFITKDNKRGGHVLDLIVKNAKVEIDKTGEFYMVLPKKEEFNKLDLEKDTQGDLDKAEKTLSRKELI